MSKTIAVFGGNRSVGRHFIEQALAHGHKIRALIRPNSKSPPLNPHENLTIIIGDAITSPAAVSETLSTASIVFTSIGATTIKSAKKDFISYNAQKVLNEAMIKRWLRGWCMNMVRSLKLNIR
ncbi:hypothetical protein G9A89_016940 [Geosiphon pyriformis]|nr:hypothetical protein G9A89_016940 [Geosiphon pyriformis]